MSLTNIDISKPLTLSRYYVLKYQFLTSTKRLLFLRENVFTLQTIPYQFLSSSPSSSSKDKDKDKEIYSYNDIQAIKLNDKNDKDFIIQFKKGEQLSLSCYKRSLLISDIYYMINKQKQIQLQQQANQQQQQYMINSDNGIAYKPNNNISNIGGDIYNNDQYHFKILQKVTESSLKTIYDINFYIYQAYIQIEYIKLKIHPDEASRFFKLSSIPSSLTNLSSTSSQSSSAMQSLKYKQYYDNHGGIINANKYNDYSHDSEISLGDNDNAKSNDATNSTTNINYCLTLLYPYIKAIEKTDDGFSIIYKDDYKYHFIINDVGKLNHIIKIIINNSKQYINHDIKITEYDRLQHSQKKNFLLSNQVYTEGSSGAGSTPPTHGTAGDGYVLEIPLYKILFTDHITPIIMRYNDGYLYEIDIINGYINSQVSVAKLIDVIKCNIGYPAVHLIFSDFTELIYLTPPNYVDTFITNIISLCKMQNPPMLSSHLYAHEFIHSHMPLYYTKVQGWPNEGIDNEYEIDLIKAFCNPRDDEYFYHRLKEFTLNAHLMNFNDNEPKSLQFLMQIFMKHAQIILTEQFIGFAEAYEKSLRYTYNLNFTHCLPQSQLNAFHYSEQKLSEADYAQLVKKLEDDMKYYTTKFQFEGTEKEGFKELNRNTYPKFILKVEEILKALTILISSKSLYREIAINKKDFQFYENVLVVITKLLDYPISIISHLAGGFLHTFMRAIHSTEKKTESINKHIVLTSKINLMKCIAQILAKKVLVKTSNYAQYIQEDAYIVPILACLRLLKTLMYERKDTTNIDDLTIVYKYMDQHYFFAIFNFLSRYKSIPCIYKTTMLMNSILQNNPNKDRLKDYQSQILNYSSLILWHIYLVLSTNHKLQRQISINFLSNLFSDNTSSCALICRIIPKSMFRRVEFASNDITKWGLSQWEQFFNMLKQTYNTPTEQWYDECRQELIEKLIKYDEEIMSNFRYLTSTEVGQLFESSATSVEISETLLNVRWNHEEIECKYFTLANKFLVWKYYLSALIKDGENSSITIIINKPATLWNELNTHFIGSTNTHEMKKILKTMILLYREYYSVLKDLTTMNYWLKIINDRDYSSCKYLILQLIYMALVVNDNYVTKFNIKKLLDLNGIHVLADVLSGLYYFEEHNAQSNCTGINDTPILNINQLSTSIFPNNTNHFTEEDIFYNYTSLVLPKQALNIQSEKCCMIYFILNIYKAILDKTIQNAINQKVEQNKIICPIPNAKSQLLEKYTMNCLINILLINDNHLTIQLLTIFENHFADKYTFKHLVNNKSFWEFLLININEINIESRLQLIKKLYHQVLNDKSSPTKTNALQLYTQIAFDPISEDIAYKAFEHFYLFKYFPRYMMHRLFSNDNKDFSQIYFSNTFETPLIIWNTYMKQLLDNTLKLHIFEYQNQLAYYCRERYIYSREEMPIMASNSADVEYPNLMEEITCGPVYLRVWVRKLYKSLKGTDSSISDDFIKSFIQGLYGLLTKALNIPLSDMSNKQLKDLSIVIKAHSKMLKFYDIEEYECFEHVIFILNHFALLYSQEFISKDIASSSPSSPLSSIPSSSLSNELMMLYSEFILDSCNIIYRAIKSQSDTNSNGESTLMTKGLKILFFTLINLLKRMNKIKDIFYKKDFDKLNKETVKEKIINDNKDIGNTNNEYYNDMIVTLMDLKILNIIIKILTIIYEKYPREFVQLNNETKTQICLSLQNISKIGVIYYNYVEKIPQSQSKENIENIMEVLDDDNTQDINTGNTVNMDDVANPPLIPNEATTNSVVITGNMGNITKNNNNFARNEDYILLLSSIFDILNIYRTSRNANHNRKILYEVENNKINITPRIINLYIDKLHSFQSTFLSFFLKLSKEITYITSIIQSGLAWRVIEYITYYNAGNPKASTNSNTGINVNATDNPNDNEEDDILNLSINDQICKSSLILRNILIYSNEAYIYKIKNTNIGSKSIIFNFKDKSSTSLPSFIDINKIDNNQRNVLIVYYESCINLLNKKLVQYLLEDISEPLIIPQDKDKQAILTFLNIFNKNSLEPDLYWNHDIILDLRNILRTQINTINTLGAKWFNHNIEKYKYKLYAQELIINDIFIKFYNFHPTWNIYNPSLLLQNIFKEINTLYNKYIKSRPSITNTNFNNRESNLHNRESYLHVKDSNLNDRESNFVNKENNSTVKEITLNDNLTMINNNNPSALTSSSTKIDPNAFVNIISNSSTHINATNRNNNNIINKIDENYISNLLNDLQNLHECCKCIENIINYHGYADEVYYSKDNFNQLNTLFALLFDEQNKYINSISSSTKIDTSPISLSSSTSPPSLSPLYTNPVYKNIQLTILKILLKLSTNLTSAIKLFENVLFIKNLIKILKNHYSYNHELIQESFDILNNVSQYDNVEQAIVRYGMYIIVLQIVINEETVSASYRLSALNLLLKYLNKNNDMYNPITKAILFYFPPSFQQIIKMSIEPAEMLKLIDTGYETPTTHWSSLIRQEILMILIRECQFIQNKWLVIHDTEIKINDDKFYWELNPSHRPIYPELDDMIFITNVNLKSFNTNPVTLTEVNYAVFIDEIATLANSIYEEFITLMNEFEYADTMAQAKLNQLDRLCCKLTILMTSLILSLDQFLNSNEHAKLTFSPNVKTNNSDNESNSVKKFNKKLVSEECLTFIVKALKFFTYKKVHLDMKCTLLQLIYLIADIERGMSILKSNDIMNYICQFINEINSENDGNSQSYLHVEEKLIYGVLLRLLIKDPDFILEISKDTISILKSSQLKNKGYISRLVKYINKIISLHDNQNHVIQMSDDDDDMNDLLQPIEKSPTGYLNTVFWKDCNNHTYNFSDPNECLMNLLRTQNPEKNYKFPIISEFAVKYLPHPIEENLDYRNKIQEFIISIKEHCSNPQNNNIDNNTNKL